MIVRQMRGAKVECQSNCRRVELCRIVQVGVQIEHDDLIDLFIS